jgi:hypothetical protein
MFIEIPRIVRMTITHGFTYEYHQTKYVNISNLVEQVQNVFLLIVENALIRNKSHRTIGDIIQRFRVILNIYKYQ